MKTALFSVFLFAGLLLLSCEGSKPESCFIIQDKGSLSVGDTVKFSNCSLNATSYAWDFGDGNTTEAFIPEHVYEAAGTYTVQLTVGNNGKSESSSETVTITP